MLVDIQAKLAEGKSEGYARWAKRYNLKEMSKTLIFLQEKKISSIEEMQECVATVTAHYHEPGDSIKAAEIRMAEIAVLKTHIFNYAKTHPVYDAYRKAGYSKKFLDTHREEITLHKAAKATFDETGLKKLPKVKALNAAYSDLLTQKKAAYPDYRKAREEMQELVKAQKNVRFCQIRFIFTKNRIFPHGNKLRVRHICAQRTFSCQIFVQRQRCGKNTTFSKFVGISQCCMDSRPPPPIDWPAIVVVSRSSFRPNVFSAHCRSSSPR